jgi:hypothetical protein
MTLGSVQRRHFFLFSTNWETVGSGRNVRKKSGIVRREREVWLLKSTLVGQFSLRWELRA